MTQAKWCPFRGIATSAILAGAITTQDEKVVDAIGRATETHCIREGCGVWNGRRCGLAGSPARQVRFLR